MKNPELNRLKKRLQTLNALEKAVRSASRSIGIFQNMRTRFNYPKGVDREYLSDKELHRLHELSDELSGFESLISLRRRSQEMKIDIELMTEEEE